MATIFELTKEYRDFLDELSEHEAGDIPEEITDAIARADGSFEDKAENYAKLIKSLEADVDAIEKEEKRLHANKMTKKRNIDWLKQTVKNSMQIVGKTKISNGLFTLTIRKNGGKLPVILNVLEEQLPDELVKVTRKADNDAIRQYIEETGDVTYAQFGERGESLVIK